ncbi:MAG: hypothetical protein M3Q48_11470 [Actinomycetota bacterium]|nr:hypothetical protein [Actinomycetota bacterium]
MLTSQQATVVGVGEGRLTARLDDGRTEVLAGDELDADHLDHAYALTGHRTQAATVERAHVLAGGGGRELAYVAMSRARGTTHVHVVADDVDQAGMTSAPSGAGRPASAGSSTPTRWPRTVAAAGRTSPAGPRPRSASLGSVPSATPSVPSLPRPPTDSASSTPDSGWSRGQPAERHAIQRRV